MAVLGSAIAFGVFHVSFFRLLPTAFLGVLLALATLWSGSIFPSMLWHAVNNGLAAFAFEDAETLPGWAVVGGAAGAGARALSALALAARPLGSGPLGHELLGATVGGDQIVERAHDLGRKRGLEWVEIDSHVLGPAAAGIGSTPRSRCQRRTRRAGSVSSSAASLRTTA